MKNRVALKISILICTLAVLPDMASAGSVRTANDLNALLTQAVQSKKLVAVFVTSSDSGCLDCARMRKDFFRDAAFNDWISRFSVYGEIDAKTAPAAVQAAHAPFVPTMVLLHPDGHLLEYQTANHVPSQTATLFHQIYLDQVVGVHQAGSAPVSLGAPVPRSGKKAEAAAPVWNPPNAVPVRYDGLKLRSITGTGSRQFVLINDQTLAVGESARITMNGKKVYVKCREIRDNQVVVEVDGEAKPRLLILESSKVRAVSTR